MQEDTDSFNDNSSSEVIILSHSNHIEETLISDEEDTESETPQSYEAKLNLKLKELGLYEDGMTIQQKEELLTVVAVSFKTAEEEKTHRQWYEEYANATLTFPEDEIEFSFQKSPESEPSQKDHPTSLEKENSTSQRNGQKLNGSLNVPTTQIHGVTAKSQRRRSQTRGEESSYKLALKEGNTVTSHSTDIISNCKDIQLKDNKKKKQFLEECMSRWRPCLSPKDEPLVRINKQMNEDTEKSCSYSESECNKKMQDYVHFFNFTLAQVKKASKNPCPFGMPYHFTQNEQSLKKDIKLESCDIMIGAQEERNETVNKWNDSISFTAQKEAFSRTTGGAFRYTQLHRDKLDTLQNKFVLINSNNSSSVLNKSPLIHGVQISEENCRTPEIIIEDSTEENVNISVLNNIHSKLLLYKDLSNQIEKEDTVLNVSDNKLPKFSNLRPNLCPENFLEENSTSKKAPHSNTNSSSVNASSFQDDELSDTSSVIDVETIVDDEIEEFVLKRKSQESVSDKQQTYSTRSKRLKKNTS